MRGLPRQHEPPRTSASAGSRPSFHGGRPSRSLPPPNLQGHGQVRDRISPRSRDRAGPYKSLLETVVHARAKDYLELLLSWGADPKRVSPLTVVDTYDVNLEQAREWLAKGATPSETVASVLRRAGCFAAPPAPPAAQA